MVSASPPPAPPALRMRWGGVVLQRWRLRNATAHGAGAALGRGFKRRGREKKRIRLGVELASTVAGEGRAGPEAAGW